MSDTRTLKEMLAFWPKCGDGGCDDDVHDVIERAVRRAAEVADAEEARIGGPPRNPKRAILADAGLEEEKRDGD